MDTTTATTSKASSSGATHNTSELEQDRFATSSNTADAAASSKPNASPSDDNKFMGQKERRKSSAVKMFLGDYLSLATNQTILKILSKNGDSTVVFSDIIIKINKRNKMQERILLITDQAIYNIDPNGHKVKRRIALKELGSVSLSKLPDNFFCIHAPSEYDYLLVSNKKTEIVTKLMEVYGKCSGDQKQLPVVFSNSFDYKIDNDVYREILFTNVEGGISTQIFTKKKKDKK